VAASFGKEAAAGQAYHIQGDAAADKRLTEAHRNDLRVTLTHALLAQGQCMVAAKWLTESD